MSHSNDIEIIENLVGSFCKRTLAGNSIKIRFGCEIDEKGTSYIWIDPPWEFQTRDKLLTESYDCPSYEDAEYNEKFSEWSNIFNPLNKIVFKGFIYTTEKELELEFDGGYYIYVPYSKVKEGDEWYEHWYAKIS